MSILRSFNPCFGLSRRTGAIAVSGFLVVASSIFVVLCFSQLGAGTRLRGGAQAEFAIASIVQVVLVALASVIIFASWKENAWLIRFSAYLTVTHLVANLIVLAFLLVSVASIGPCKPGRPRCPKLLLPKSVWNVLYAIILSAQLYLSLVVLSYLFYLQDHSRRAYIPEISSRGLSAPPSQKPDHKHLLSNPEGYSTVELGPVESRTTTRSLSTPEPGAGYGGGMRTYEEAEENEKARLRREMENEETQVNMSFPIPSSSETPILTPLGLQWRDGDLPPYAS